MPKLNKRKRQLKTIYLNRKSPAEPSGAQENSYIEESSNETGSEEDEDAQGDDDRPWVQCNSCNKWRSLPKTVDLSKLPEVWDCTMNAWDPERATCTAPQEDYQESDDGSLRAFFQLWVKRLKCAEKAESRLPLQTLTRGKKKRSSMQWVQCCNPSCGKWRSIGINGFDVHAMLLRLNSNNPDVQGNWGTIFGGGSCGGNSSVIPATAGVPQNSSISNLVNFGLSNASSSLPSTNASSASAATSTASRRKVTAAPAITASYVGLLWFCCMNSWDYTKASCDAPQEPLFDAPWNLAAYDRQIGSR